jgi:hypothetical protein
MGKLAAQGVQLFLGVFEIGAVSDGNASTICCASHSAVGYRVTANQSSCRRP